MATKRPQESPKPNLGISDLSFCAYSGLFVANPPNPMVAERYCLLPRPVSPPPIPTPLTVAEQRVGLSYVCAGYSNKEIARFLGKAEPTVKHQVSACLRKFGLSSRMRLMAALR